MQPSLRIIGGVALLLAAQVRAEIPPLPDNERARVADAIVSATVGEIAKTETGNETYSDTWYAATIVVTGVHKGKVPKKGETITVHYWQAGRRPEGWTGPGGQYEGLPRGERVKLFLSLAGKDRYELLSPNGWVRLKPGGERKPK